MDEARLWGLLGLVLAAAGAVVIAPDVLRAVGTLGEGPGPIMLVGYGVGAVVAVLAVLAVVGPDVVGRRAEP
jgi:hypothetical protein